MTITTNSSTNVKPDLPVLADVAVFFPTAKRLSLRPKRWRYHDRVEMGRSSTISWDELQRHILVSAFHALQILPDR